MCAQRLIRSQVCSFRQQPQIHLLQQRAKAIGIIYQVLLAVPVHRQLIAERVFAAWNDATEEAACIFTRQLRQFAPGGGFNDPHFKRFGEQCPDFKALLSSVHP